MAALTATLSPTRISPLVMPERLSDFTVRYFIPYSDIALASATSSTDSLTLTLGTTPTTWTVQGALAYIYPAFAGTTALTCTVGTSTTPNAFLASTSVLTAGAWQPANGAGSVNTPASSQGVAAINLVAVFTNATGGSMSSLTAGGLEILLSVIDPTILA